MLFSGENGIPPYKTVTNVHEDEMLPFTEEENADKNKHIFPYKKQDAHKKKAPPCKKNALQGGAVCYSETGGFMKLAFR